MVTVYHLSSCSTCKRILSGLPARTDYLFRDIKLNPLQPAEVDELAKRAGGYLALLSKRSQQYKILGINPKEVDEVQARTLLIQHYTFLMRPVVVHNAFVSVGNAASTVEALYNHLR